MSLCQCTDRYIQFNKRVTKSDADTHGCVFESLLSFVKTCHHSACIQLIAQPHRRLRAESRTHKVQQSDHTTVRTGTIGDSPKNVSNQPQRTVRIHDELDEIVPILGFCHYPASLQLFDIVFGIWHTSLTSHLAQVLFSWASSGFSSPDHGM